jgi:hypothetical protein
MRAAARAAYRFTLADLRGRRGMVSMRTYSDRERNHQSGGSKARIDPIKGGDG